MNAFVTQKTEGQKKHHELIVIGASWGGLEALSAILSSLPSDFPLPILIVQHRPRNPLGSEFFIEILNRCCQLNVLEPDDKEHIETGNIYLAPSNYHMLVEHKRALALSNDDPVHYSRPSIDLLFESAAESYQQNVIGIILTGANQDGAEGLKIIKEKGGYTLAQDPTTAEVDTMPLAAIAAAKPDMILPLKDIAPFLITLGKTSCYQK